MSYILARYRLRVDLWDWEGGRVYAEYDHFAVGSRDTNYKLTARGYTGNAGQHRSCIWAFIDLKK